MSWNVATVRANIAQVDESLARALEAAEAPAMRDVGLADARGGIGDPTYYAFGDRRMAPTTSSLSGSGFPMARKEQTGSTVLGQIENAWKPVEKFGTLGDQVAMSSALDEVREAGFAIRQGTHYRGGAELAKLEVVDDAAIQSARQRLATASALLAEFDGTPKGNAIAGAIRGHHIKVGAGVAAAAAAVAGIGYWVAE